jgi:hypothetical protein
VKLIYAAVFALFPLAAPAQTLDSSLLSALCTDDRYEDTADQCSCTIETVLEKYSTTLPQGTDEGLAAIFLATPGDDCAFRRSRPGIPREGGRLYRLKRARDSDDPGRLAGQALVSTSSSGQLAGSSSSF